MPFCTTVTGFPAKVEKRNLKSETGNWKLENGKLEIGNSKFETRGSKFENQSKAQRAVWDAPIGGPAYGTDGEFLAGGHDMYEKTGTYLEERQNGPNSMLLITWWLPVCPESRVRRFRGKKYSGRSHDVTENKGNSK
jgi:hypothetical protein